MYDVIIIGAGASGLMAAAAAASKGARVALLEHKDDIGKKILATGNGRCNFTNTDMSVNKFHGNKALIKNGLSQFNYADTIRFFKELGIPAYDNAGYIYPNSRQAASVVAAFRMELMRLHVDVKTGISITEIKAAGITTKDTNSAANPVTNKKTDDRTGYCIQTDKGSFKSKRLIIACGLTASPKLGSDGSLFRRGLQESVAFLQNIQGCIWGCPIHVALNFKTKQIEPCSKVVVRLSLYLCIR